MENLNSNKCHGRGVLSIKMTKLCCKFIAYLLKLIFEASLLGGEFPECWKRANVLPVHKKETSGEKLQTNKSSCDFYKIF